jgi:hypothetical protein
LVIAVVAVGCVAPAAPQTGVSVSGQAVATGTTRLYSDANMANLAFEIDGSRIYQGTVQQGQAILFFDGTTVFRGANSTGEKLFTVDNDKIYVGGSTAGPVAYTLDGEKVYEGSGTQGTILYNIDSERLFKGASTTGEVVFQGNKDLAGDVVPLLPILADERF